MGSCAGEYSLTGVWVSETQRWTLSPRVWLTNPCNYAMLGFSGTIDVVAGLRRFSGRVVGGFGVLCSTFTLMESTGTAPSSCASSGTLILGVPTVPYSLARSILSGTVWYLTVPLWSSGADLPLLRCWCQMPPTRMFTTDIAGPPNQLWALRTAKWYSKGTVGYSRGSFCHGE